MHLIGIFSIFICIQLIFTVSSNEMNEFGQSEEYEPVPRASGAFLRFGRESPPTFLRFGRAPPEFLRFGREPSSNKFLRFGRRAGEFLRFG